MPEKPFATKKLSDKNTKQEMMEAYHSLVEKLEERSAAELNPARKLEEQKVQESVKTAESIAADEVDLAISKLKTDIVKSLAAISDRLQAEVTKYRGVQKAVSAKEKELQDLYGIEKSAATLAALIEAQNQKRSQFETEMTTQTEALNQEIESTRAEWDQEKKARENELKERDAADKKARERDKEEFTYLFKRDSQAIKDKLADEKAVLEKELKLKKEAADKDLAEREKAIGEKEQELAQLRERVTAFPKELDATVEKTVKQAVERVQTDARNREELLKKQFEGEKNVLTTRIESAERNSKDTAAQLAKLSSQLEAAYQKVQEIAEKAIEGSSQSKSFVELQKMLTEQTRKGSQDKG